MKLPKFLIVTGLALLGFSLYKIWQEMSRDEYPWQLRTNQAEMDYDAWKRLNGNGWITVPQDRPL